MGRLLKSALVDRLTGPAPAPARTTIFAGHAACWLWIAAIASGVLAAAAPRPADAQIRSKYFFMERPNVVSTTEYEFEEEERITRSNKLNETTNTLIKELEISTQGWVYHPALAIFSLSLRPEFEIEKSRESNNFRRTDKTLFFGYTFDSTFLQFKPYTFKLFSSRDRAQLDSTLSRNTVTDSATNRATAILKYEPLPTTFTAEHRKRSTSGFFDSEERTITLSTDSRHLTDQSRTSIRSEYKREERKIANATIDIDRLQLNVSNSYDYSDDTRFLSVLRGDITSLSNNDIKNLNASETMSVDHLEDLRGQYGLRADTRRDSNSFSNSYTGTASLSHQLYENLTTTGYSEFMREDFSTGTRHAGEANLDFDYRRRIPGGRIGVTNGYSYRLEDNDVDPVITTVLDESLVLSGLSLVFLANLNVDTTTIVVTNLGGVPFVENVDYIVADIGGSIGIARVLLGGIADPETVLVDYRFTPTGANRLSEFKIHAGANVSLWDSLTLSYNFSRSKENLISGIPPATLADETTHRWSGQFRWRFSTTTADYEIRQSSRTPQKRWSASERLFFRPLDRMSANASLSYREILFENTNQKTKSTSGSLGLRWSPVRWGNFTVNARARRISGDVQRSDDRGIEAAFRWRVGLWSGKFSYDILRQLDHRSGQQRRRQAFLVQVTRKLWR